MREHTSHPELELHETGGSSDSPVGFPRPPPVASFIAPARASRWGQGVLALSFLLFGLALGQLTGFASSTGMSQLLMTSLFSFVGGVLLSYAGFRRREGEAPDPLRLGLALGGFALGLMFGTPAGVYLRCNRHANSWFVGETLSRSACLTPAGAFRTEGENVSQGPAPMAAPAAPACKQAVKNLSLEIPSARPDKLYPLLSVVIDQCELPR